MYVGIDFGTCYSQIATMRLNEPFMLLPPGEYGIPSEFYYDSETDVMIGEDALGFGQGYAAANLKSEVKMDLSNNFTADGRTFTPSEMIGYIYRHLAETGTQIAKNNRLDAAIKGAVISVPAKFTMQERVLIREAAEKCLGAGNPIKVTGVIKEPVAAALAYYHDPLANGSCVLVYDLGGGTCDVAIMQADDSLRERFDVLDSDMIRLGGRDWDNALVDYIADNLSNKAGINVRDDVGHMEKIRRAAIQAKHKLSAPSTTMANARIEINGRLYPIPIKRSTFDEITVGLLNQTMDLLKKVHDRYVAKGKKIDEIICVGGSSNMPQVAEGISRTFPNLKVNVFMPEHAVVFGTAIYADMLGDTVALGNDVGNRLNDIADFSYGIRCYENYSKDPNYRVVANIIRINEPLPVTRKHYFSPVSDTHKTVCLSVYESEYDKDTFPYSDPNRRKVGELNFTLSSGHSRKTEITCTMTLTKMGTLEVSAVDDKGASVKSTFKLEKI